MSRRATSLSNIGDLAVNRVIDSKYDIVKQVAAKLDQIELVAEQDVEALTASLNEALDFAGITVVGGVDAGWDPVTKILTVPTIQGEVGPQGLPGINGTDGVDGADGLTPNVQFSVSPDGVLEYEVTYN